MTIFEQTKHLLYRNYLLKIRNKKETLLEIFLPIFFMLMLASIRATIPVRDEPAIERSEIPTFSLFRDFPLFANNDNSTPTVAFVSNNLTKVKEVMNVLRSHADGRVNFTESESVQLMTDTYRSQREKYSFGLVFEASESSYLGLKYTLLSPYKNQPNTRDTLVEIGKVKLVKV